jgi:hypothetical protein
MPLPRLVDSLPRLACLASVVIPLATILAPPDATARDLFRTALTVDGFTFGGGTNDATTVWRLLRQSSLGASVPFYQDRSALVLRIDLRGLPATLSSPRNGTDILLRVGRNGEITRLFTGATRDEATERFNRFLTGREDPAGMRRVIKEWVATSPVDPVAGNPASLLGRSVAADLDLATRLPGDDGGMAPRVAGWHGSAGLGFDDHQLRDFETRGYSLPLGLSYAFGEDGPEAFLQAPLAINETNGAHTFLLSLAAGLRLPVVATPDLRWSVTPSLRLGAGGSERVGGGGILASGALGSDLRLALGPFTLGLGNSIGRTQIEPLKIDDVELPYHVRSWAFRNSLSLSRPVGQVGGMSLGLGVSFTDTRLAGDAMAVPSWQEYGITAKLGQQAPVQLGVSLLDGENNYHGMRVTLTASF